MHIPDLHDYDPPMPDVAKQFLSDDSAKAITKQIKDIAETVLDDEFARLEDYAAEYISQLAAWRAEKFLERVLNGDIDAAKYLLQSNCSRYRNDCTPWANLIHGTLWQTDAMKLREQIVAAHADVIRNERILDLESIVDGLTKQVRELTASLDAMRDRYR